MTASNTSEFNPFEPAVAEETDELNRLTRALELAEGFTLLLARCNQPDQRRRLVACFRAGNPQFNIQEIHFSEPIHHLLDELRVRITDPLPDAVFVSGLENSLPCTDAAYATPVILNLNAARNSFPSIVPCPLVLWLPEYVLGAVMRGAPDFFSIRSGVYYFVADPRDPQVVEQFFGSMEPGIRNSTTEEKNERTEVIQRLLEDYASMPVGQRDYLAEIRLRLMLVTIQIEKGDLHSAENHLQEALDLTREQGLSELLAVCLGTKADLLMLKGELEDAERSFLECLINCKTTNMIGNEARMLLRLGNLSIIRNKLELASDYFQKALAVNQISNYPDIVTGLYTGLGILNVRIGDYKNAERYFTTVINTASQSGEFKSLAIANQNLGTLSFNCGQSSKAEDCFRRAMSTCGMLGDRYGYALALCSLARVKLATGRYRQALQDAKEALQVSTESGDSISAQRAEELVEVLAPLCEATGGLE